MKSVRIAPLASLSAAIVTASAFAQDAQIKFRVVPAKDNPVGCTNLDGALSRVHTNTVGGDKATLKSSGGINGTPKQSSQEIHKTAFRLRGVTLEVMADASATPNTLAFNEAKRGYHWTAVAS